MRVVTGLEYTTANMLAVFYNLQNSELEILQMHTRHEEIRRRLLRVMNELNSNLIPNAQLFHNMATHGSFTRLRPKEFTRFKPCAGGLLAGVPQVAAWVMAIGPGASHVLVGWEKERALACV